MIVVISTMMVVMMVIGRTMMVVISSVISSQAGHVWEARQIVIQCVQRCVVMVSIWSSILAMMVTE